MKNQVKSTFIIGNHLRPITIYTYTFFHLYIHGVYHFNTIYIENKKDIVKTITFESVIPSLYSFALFRFYVIRLLIIKIPSWLRILGINKHIILISFLQKFNK